VPKAAEASEAEPPLGGPGSRSDPGRSSGAIRPALNPRTARAGQERMGGDRPIAARRHRATLVGLREDLGKGPVGLDTVAFIYFIEEHPDYLPLLDPIFEAVDQGALHVVTSSLTLLEVLVIPYRSGNLPLAQKYERLLTRS